MSSTRFLIRPVPSMPGSAVDRDQFCFRLSGLSASVQLCTEDPDHNEQTSSSLSLDCTLIEHHTQTRAQRCSHYRRRRCSFRSQRRRSLCQHCTMSHNSPRSHRLQWGEPPPAPIGGDPSPGSGSGTPNHERFLSRGATTPPDSKPSSKRRRESQQDYIDDRWVLESCLVPRYTLTFVNRPLAITCTPCRARKISMY